MTAVHDPKTRAAMTYDAASDCYDHPALSFWERFGSQTVERLGLKPGYKVLDAGCGSGASAIPAAKCVGPTGYVLGVDLSERLLCLARKKAAAANLENVEFRAGDMLNIRGPDANFDAVISVFSIFFVSDMIAATKLLWKKVIGGGRLAITTWGPRFAEPMNSVWWESVKAERADLYKGFNPWDKVTTPQLLEGLMHDAGATNIQTEAQSGLQKLERPEDWWAIVLGSGYRWTVEQLDPAARERVRAKNIEWARQNSISQIEMNVVFGVATKAN